jgi:hypothetical protein
MFGGTVQERCVSVAIGFLFIVQTADVGTQLRVQKAEGAA